MTALTRTTAIAVALTVFTASAAFAQAERPQRMFRGLFGGPAPNPDRHTQADLDVSLFGEYDSDIAAAHGGGLPSANAVGGASSGFSLGLTFSTGTRHVDFAVSGGSDGEYYPALHRTTTIGDQASASFGVHGSRASAAVMQSAAYSPLFMLAPFAAPAPSSAAEVPAAPVNAAVLTETMLSYSTGVTGDLNLGPRWSLGSNAAITRSTVRYTSGPITQRGWTAGAMLHRQMSAAAGLHVGFTEQVMSPRPGLPEFRVYNADLGMDYHKALGRTHKTTMSFSFGSGMIQEGARHQYSALGDASLNREIGRTWVAQATYNRGIGMVAGFDRPLFSDSISGSIGGLVTRRVDVNTSVAYTNGEIGLTGVTNNFGGYNGSARVRYAISQLYAVYGQYNAYWYDLANHLYIATPLPPNVLRQSVQVGVTLWLPLVR